MHLIELSVAVLVSMILAFINNRLLGKSQKSKSVLLSILPHVLYIHTEN